MHNLIRCSHVYAYQNCPEASLNHFTYFTPGLGDYPLFIQTRVFFFLTNHVTLCCPGLCSIMDIHAFVKTLFTFLMLYLTDYRLLFFPIISFSYF